MVELENLDSLITALIDLDAQMGLFKKELSRKLDIPLVCIGNPFLESEIINGVVKQYVYVPLSDKVAMGKLLSLGFDYFHDGFIVFEIGDIVL